MFAELIAAILALKEIASSLKQLVVGVEKLRQDAIDSALSQIRNDVNETISKIQSAINWAPARDLDKIITDVAFHAAN